MVIWMSDAPATNHTRRLGERLHLGEVLIAWRVDEVIPGRVRDRPRPPEVGRMIDVSVSGAAIVAPAATELRPGRAVVIRLDDAESVVRIRRIVDFGEDGWLLYGVELMESDLVFRDWINGLLDVRRPQSVQAAWESAD